MLATFRYAAPALLEEVVSLLSETPGGRPLAGGQSLLTEMKLRHVSPALLVDLRNIQAMRGIEYRSDGSVRIGAMTTLTELLEETALQASFPALTDALRKSGDAQMRNSGTLGGDLASSTLGTDLPAVALALEATLNTFGPDGYRSVPAQAFLASDVGAGNVIISVDFPASASNAASAYEKFKNRASGYAICGVAAYVALLPDGTLNTCRVAVTGATRQAMRLPQIETALVGSKPTAEGIAAACQVDGGANFITDLAASADYRRHLTGVLARRALTRALDR